MKPMGLRMFGKKMGKFSLNQISTLNYKLNTANYFNNNYFKSAKH